MKKYITVEEHGKDGGVYCTGIFDDWYAAFGHISTNILEFKQSYKDPGDLFELSEPFIMDGEGGWCIVVKFKAACWTHMEEPSEHYYYILFHTCEGSEE